MTNNKNLTPEEMIQYMYSFGLEGNIIDHSWYKIVRREPTKTRPAGRPHREAIELLSDIVYWYRPTIKKKENGSISLTKKFRADILQRSYDQIEESLGMTKKEAVEALKTLEKYGIAKRELRTIKVSGATCSNVLFIRFYPQKLKSLTDEYLKKVVSYPEYSGQPPPEKEIPLANIRETYTETSTETSSETSKDIVDTAPFKKKNKKSLNKAMENFNREESDLYEKLKRIIPEWGEKIDPDSITFWITEWGSKRVEEVLDLYWERVLEAKVNGGIVRSMGATIRDALNKGEKPKSEDFEKNLQYAKIAEKKHEFVIVRKNYVKFTCGTYLTELFFKMPQQLFINSFDEKLQNCQIYT